MCQILVNNVINRRIYLLPKYFFLFFLSSSFISLVATSYNK